MGFEDYTTDQLQAEIDRRSTLDTLKPTVNQSADLTATKTLVAQMIDDLAQGRGRQGVSVSDKMLLKTLFEDLVGTPGWNWIKANK